MSYARKVDSVQAEIIQALEQCGWTVQDTSRLGGFVDAVAVKGHWKLGPYPVVRLLEFKTGQGKLTKAQQQFHAKFPVTILRGVDDALKLR